MTASAKSALVKHVWQRFQEVGFTPDFGPEGSRLLIALYRRLAATGQPVGPDEVRAIAESLEVSPEQAADLIAGTAETDDDGNVRGIVGLSLNDHPHRFIVGEHELRNWCALDPLLIVPTISGEVQLESTDPQTGKPVRVSANARGVQSQQPDEAVMSIVVPQSGAAASVEAVWMTFCHQVHFFGSRKAGEQFFEGRDFEIYFLRLDEAFELGRLTFAPLYAELTERATQCVS